MAISAVLGFWLVAALLIVVPGPDWAFAIGSGLRGQVVPGAAGIVLGYLVMTVVVAAGVGALVASTPVALTVLTVAGGLYLLRLGASAVLHPSGRPEPSSPTDGPSSRGTRRRPGAVCPTGCPAGGPAGARVPRSSAGSG